LVAETGFVVAVSLLQTHALTEVRACLAVLRQP
jgi:hypothetical protein